MPVKKDIRLSKLTNKSFILVVDTSSPLIQGKIEGMDNLREIIRELDQSTDALILNFGQFCNNSDIIGYKNSAIKGIRIDWTDYGGKQYTILEKKHVNHEVIFSPYGVDSVGGDFCFLSYIFGVNDDFEVKAFANISKVVLDANKHSLPTILEIIPYKENQLLASIEDGIKLALSMNFELGIDMFCIPPIDKAVLKEIRAYINKPILMRLNTNDEEEIERHIENSRQYIHGVILGERVFSNKHYKNVINKLYNKYSIRGE